MPPTALPKITRYWPQGKRKYYWVTSIATQSAPTRTELNAGTDLTPQIANVSGFTLTADVIDVTPLGSQVMILVNSTLETAYVTNEILFYAASNSSDARSVLPIGTTGFLVFLYEGDVTGQLCEVWPANVNSMYFEQDAKTPGEIHIQFTITAPPSQNVTIP